MSDERKEIRTGGGGIGFVGLLTILFVGLKLTGYIDWSWWWVLSPIWITAGVWLLMFVVCMGILAVMVAVDKRRKK